MVHFAEQCFVYVMKVVNWYGWYGQSTQYTHTASQYESCYYLTKYGLPQAVA